jgi:hypothetical protein
MSLLKIRNEQGEIVEIPAIKGRNGKSAYELYKEVYPDYTGTLEEWLESFNVSEQISVINSQLEGLETLLASI